MPWFTRFLINLAVLLLFIKFLPDMMSGVKHTYEHFAHTKTKVGVVSIKHIITDANPYIHTLKEFFKDNSIKAIVLQFDCPGGCSGSSQALALELQQLKKDYPKPVVAYVENMCASGAYHVAAAADSIVSVPSAVVGSIGVYIAQPYFKAFIEHYKLQLNFVKTGKYKTTGNPFVEPTPEKTALLQSMTDDTYAQFVADVSAMRPKLAIAKSADWADGKVFTAKQAKELGLVDVLGSQSALVKELKDKTHFDNEIDWVHGPKHTLITELFGSSDDDLMSHVGSIKQLEQVFAQGYEQLMRQSLSLQA